MRSMNKHEVLSTRFGVMAWIVIISASVILSGCEATHETAVLADHSRKEASEKGGVLAYPAMPPSRLTIPGGARFPVRLLQSISSRNAHPGDEFRAELAAPVQVDGRIAFPRGSHVRGRIVSAHSSGRLEHPGYLQLTLESIQNMDGRWLELHTTSVSASGGSHKNRNTTLIAGTAGVGALIGGLAGGGKGLAIGAASGAGAGTAGAYITGKKDVTFSAEHKFTFATTEELTMNR